MALVLGLGGLSSLSNVHYFYGICKGRRAYGLIDLSD